MPRRDQVLSLFGASPAQISEKLRQERMAEIGGMESPYAKMGYALGTGLGKVFGREDPRMTEARRRTEIGQGVLSQYDTREQAQAQQQQADQMMDAFGFSPELPLTPDQQLQRKLLNDAEMYSELSKRYIAEGMLNEGELARQLTQESMTKAMDIQTAILDAEYKKQQISSSQTSEGIARAKEFRDITAEEQKQTAREKLLGIANNEAALKDIGFPQTLATRIANSPNKEAYLKAIEKRLETIATTDEGDGISTDQKNQQTLIKLVKDRRNALAQGDTDKAEMLGIEINSFAGILGLNSAKFEGVVVDSLDKTQKASELDMRASDLIARIESVKDDMKSGVPARVDEGLKAVFGDQDRFTVLQAQYASIRNSSVLQYLPPGVASDRDVALVLEGTIDRYSSPEAMMSFLRGVQKIAAAEKKYHEARLDYLSNPEVFGNPVGFQRKWRNDQYDARVDALRQIGYAEDKAVEYADTPLSFSDAVQAKRGDSRKTLEELKKRRELVQ